MEKTDKRGRPKVKKPPLKDKKWTKIVAAPLMEGKFNTKKAIVYEISDKNFGVLRVRSSANAWWIERSKVEDIIKAFKIDCTVLEACYSAGITPRQYEYFCEVHPEFCDIKRILSTYPCFKARTTLVDSLTDPKFALSYLERKRKDEFSLRQEQAGVDGKPLFDKLEALTDDELDKEYKKLCEELQATES